MRISTTFKSPFSGTKTERRSWKSGGKNVKTVQEPEKKNQILCHEIKPNLSKDRATHDGDNPSFLDEFINLRYS
jgi:hypothetical protein